MNRLKNEMRSRIQSSILDFMRTNRWKDPDDFSTRLADDAYAGLTNTGPEEFNLEKSLSRIKTSFFIINRLTKQRFISLFESELESTLRETAKASMVGTYLFPHDIFPKMHLVSDKQAEAQLTKIRGKEEILRGKLAVILRGQGASPIPRRGKDSPLEVADVELFRTQIKGVTQRIAVIVKGYNSVGKLNHEAVAHQIERAFQRGKPDHIIIATAKEPVDGLITTFDEYAESVGRPNLITFIPPVDLIKILVAYDELDDR